MNVRVDVPFIQVALLKVACAERVRPGRSALPR
jgi:hypothetical protein